MNVGSIASLFDENIVHKIFDSPELTIWYKDLQEQLKMTENSYRSLIESEDRYRSLVEVSPTPIIVHQERKIVLVNRA
ncbi:MAG: hypothetical protein ACJ8MO_10625, partial [Bacillus sp. (in: firmicutes)]